MFKKILTREGNWSAEKSNINQLDVFFFSQVPIQLTQANNKTPQCLCVNIYNFTLADTQIKSPLKACIRVYFGSGGEVRILLTSASLRS